MEQEFAYSLLFVDVEEEGGDEDAAELEVQFKQPEPVVALALEQVGHHQQVSEVQSAVLLRVLDEQRPQRTVAHQRHDVLAQQQPQDVNGPKPPEPPHDLEHQNLD